MNTLKIIAELREERTRLDQVIMTLERLASGQGRRRGRPPAWMKDGATAIAINTRKPFSEETKRKMALAQKRRWAAHRKATGSSTAKAEK